MIRIELDTVRKDMNRSEWRMINRARATIPGTRATTLQSVGDGDNIRHLCRALVSHGVTGLAQAYRGQIASFSQPFDVLRMAGGTWGKEKQPEQLKKAVK